MKQFFPRTFEAIGRARRFVFHDVWVIGTPGEEPPRGFIIKQVRVIILLGIKLLSGMHMVRAGALTFATLLSIVPLLAVLFFAIQRLDLGEQIYSFVENSVETVATRVAPERQDAPPPAADPAAAPAPVEEAAEASPVAEAVAVPEGAEDSSSIRLQRDIISALFQGVTSRREDMKDPVDGISSTAESLAKLANDAATNSTALTVSGILLVLTTVFGLMRNVENVFNQVWGVRRRRAWHRTIADYLLIMLLGPFVVAAVMGVLAALQSEAVSRAVGPFAFALGLGQYVLVIVVLTSLYRFVPNTTVKFRYALLAGVVAGTLWVLLSLAYVQFQFGLTRYAVILSAFAQFPVLLMWIYLSWAIVLLGCEIAYAYQHESTFALERYAPGASYAYREALGLRAMIEIGLRFSEGRPGFTAEEGSEAWNVPLRLLNDALEALADAGIIAAGATDPVEYRPARALETIAAGDVLKALREAGTAPSRFLSDSRFKKMFDEIGRGDRVLAGATIAELVRDYPATLDPPAPAHG